MNEQNLSNEVIINISDSGDSRKFEDNNIIHRDEFNKLIGWIDDRIQKNVDDRYRETKLNEDHIRYHDTITILGTRGSGKSSFILSLREYYKGDITKCYVLPIIDPTLIEEKGHVFLHVISIIKHAVETRIDQEEIIAGLNTRKDWDKLVDSFAHGLPLIDGVGGTLGDNKWQDPEYIMHRGIRAVNAAKDLEKNFIQVINKALEILKKEAFIVTFDDIDVDFKRGWPVLEMIRKYFTSPKLITIISGDLRLFSLAIRKHQWTNFGRELLINEGDRQNRIGELNDRVTEMESQYLQKVLKPEFRIHLTTLNEKVKLKKLFIISGRVIKGKEISGYYNEVLGKYGVVNPYQAEPYRTHLLSLPLRTQIRFMSSVDTGDYKSASISNPFVSDLYEKRVNIDLVRSNPGFLNIEILNLLLREKMLSEAYQLQPTTNDESLNSCILALNLTFAQEVSKGNPHLIFDYLIKVGYVRNLMSALGYLDDRGIETKSDLVPSIEGLCKYAQVNQDKVMRDIVGLITSYIKGYLETQGSSSEAWGGILELHSLAEKSKKGIDADKHRLDRVFQTEQLSKRIIGFIPASICKYSTKQEGRLVYSVYNLLGCISDLILRSNSSRKDIRQGLLELSQIRTYIMPDFRRVTTEVTASEAVQLDIDEESEGEIKSLNDALVGWIESFPTESAISPHLLGKISTRMFYAFDNIQTAGVEDNLGSAFSRRIVALMNAILIEDIKENIGYIKQLNINNTNESAKIFADNLNALRVSQSASALTFSRWMLACPLFICYLELADERLRETLNWFIGHNMQNSRNFSIADTLKSVSLKSNSKNITDVNIDTFLNSYEGLYNYLRNSNILPYEVFMLVNDVKQTREWNKYIRTDFEKRGFDVARLTSTYLRNFRKYLISRRLKW